MKLNECSDNKLVRDWWLHPQQLADAANWLLQQKITARHGTYPYAAAWKGVYKAWKNVSQARPETRGYHLYFYLERLTRSMNMNALTPMTMARKQVALHTYNHLCNVIEQASDPYKNASIYWNNKAWYVFFRNP